MAESEVPPAKKPRKQGECEISESTLCCFITRAHTPPYRVSVLKKTTNGRKDTTLFFYLFYYTWCDNNVETDLGTPRSNGINNGVGPTIGHHQPIRTMGNNGQMRRPAPGPPIGVRASPVQLGQFNAFGRPPPSSPKFIAKPSPSASVLQSAVSPPKITIPNQVRTNSSKPVPLTVHIH